MKQLGRGTGNRPVSLMGWSVRNDIPALGGEQARQYGTSTQNTAQVLSGKSWLAISQKVASNSIRPLSYTTFPGFAGGI